MVAETSDPVRVTTNLRQEDVLSLLLFYLNRKMNTSGKI